MVLQQREPSDTAPPETVTDPLDSVIKAGPRRRAADRSARRFGVAIPYRAILDHALDATVITDQEGYIIFVNQKTELLFDYTRAKLLGEPIEQLIPARFQVAHRRHRAAYSVAPLARPMGIGLKLWGRRSNGEEFPVEVSLRPLKASGALLIIATIRDISERQRLETAQANTEQEARLREEAALEVNQRMEQFLATASHDLRNPVTAALGSVQMAQRRARNLATTPSADAEAAHSGVLGDLERANHALHRLNRLVGRLFDLTQVQLGQMELKLASENLSDLVRAAVEAQRAVSPERAIHLRVPVDGSVPVFVDADRIDQVLTNYLANAAKYSPIYKPITARLEVEAGRQARVSVQDHGPGVPAAEQVAIWEIHHRVAGVIAESEQPGSLGLGLYLCKNLIERHGGQVGISSAPKRGATFWFTLPLTSL